MDFVSTLGTAAAVCSTLSFYPQLRKCWLTGSAGDLSLWTFGALAVGVALWTAYGLLRGDWIIIGANTATLVLLSGILFFKVRDMRRATGQRPFLSAKAGGR